MFNLKSKIAGKTLRYFFINPSKKNYINELARIIEADPGNLSRKLQELEKEGILSSEFMGEQRYYFLNKKYPLLKEVKKAFELKYGLGDLIVQSLKKIKGIKEAYIFGSYAKGDFEAESDIDVLIIGDHPVMEATKALLPVQKIIKREINVVDLTEKEFAKKKKNKDNWLGFNASTNSIGNLKDAGIVDPLKVVKTAFTNAVSVAANYLTIGAAITEIPKKESGGIPGGGMPEMGGY